MEEERMEQPRRRRKPKSFFRRLLELPKKTLLTLNKIVDLGNRIGLNEVTFFKMNLSF